MLYVYMPIMAAVISLILLIVYCAKEKVKIKENNIYLAMLIIILMDSLLMTAIYVDLGKHEGLIKLLNKFEYMMLVGWTLCLCGYTHVVIHKKDEIHLLRQRITRIVLGVPAILQVAFIWILPLEAIKENGIVTVITGPAVYFTFSCCAVNLLLSVSIVLFNVKKVTKQITPVFIFLGIAGLCAVIYYFNPAISGVSMGLAIVNLTMYFTIENPDVQMLEKVNLAKEQALRANQAKTDFLSSMSHEIRTPINAIAGFAECIKNDKTLEEAKSDAGDILRATENLLEIVNGILDISKIEAGRMEVVNKEYNLVEMAENLSKLIRARIGEKPIELRVSLDENIPGILYGDESKLRQVMTNLLTNAVKYTDTGYVDFSIDCVNSGGKANLFISVSDTGHGIKSETMNGLFDKFKRLEEDRNSSIEGTGLGLAITKQFVEMLQGTIEVHSIYGKGSTFTVKLSQKIVSLEKKAEEKASETVKEFPGKRILVVDDTSMNLIVAKRILELYKVEADTAGSGEECIEKCKSEVYDMILLDDMMPKMTGKETLDRLLEKSSFATPVVAFTANAIDGMKDKYLSEGYADYLSKPLDKPELCRVLEKIFE